MLRLMRGDVMFDVVNQTHVIVHLILIDHIMSCTYTHTYTHIHAHTPICNIYVRYITHQHSAQREKRLLDLLTTYHATRTNLILIFVLYKREAEHVAEYLNKYGW